MVSVGGTGFGETTATVGTASSSVLLAQRSGVAFALINPIAEVEHAQQDRGDGDDVFHAGSSS